MGMRVGIFGTDYAGLVTAVGLADVGHTITATDKDPDIVARLSDGTPTIHEPGLQELLTVNLEAGRLRFTTPAEDAMSASNIIFLCVGTPPRADGRADLSQVAGFEYYSLGRGEATFHGAETGARMSVRRRSSVTVTRGQNSQVPV